MPNITLSMEDKMEDPPMGCADPGGGGARGMRPGLLGRPLGRPEIRNHAGEEPVYIASEATPRTARIGIDSAYSTPSVKSDESIEAFNWSAPDDPQTSLQPHVLVRRRSDWRHPGDLAVEDRARPWR